MYFLDVLPLDEPRKTNKQKALSAEMNIELEYLTKCKNNKILF